MVKATCNESNGEGAAGPGGGPRSHGSRQGAERLLFLDNLRAFVVVLVVMFHGAIGYMVHMPPWWYVPDARKLIVVDGFLALTDVFMMPLMLLIAGYFAQQSLQCTSPGRFLLRRASRLVPPWVVGVVVFTPIITYMSLVAHGQSPKRLGAFWLSYFDSDQFHHAHYWFLGFLAAMSAGLAAWVSVTGRSARRPTGKGLSTPGYLGVLGACAASMWLINLWVPDDKWWVYGYVVSVQPTRLGTYVIWFVLGVVARRRGWFVQGGYVPSSTSWAGLAVASAIALLVWKGWSLGRGGMSVMVINALVHSTFCLASGMGCLGAFHRYADRDPGALTGLVRNSFGIYFIHFVIVVGLALRLTAWDLPAGAKWAVVSFGSLAASWCVSEFALVRLPWIRRVFR